jgi:hypothetical protein
LLVAKPQEHRPTALVVGASEVRPSATWSRMGARVSDPGALVLLGDYLGQLLLELLAWQGAGRQDRPGEALFERPAQVRQLICGHLWYRVQ